MAERQTDDDLVWVVIDKTQTVVSRGYASANDLKVASDDPAVDQLGNALPDRQANGRPLKPRASVSGTNKASASDTDA